MCCTVIHTALIYTKIRAPHLQESTTLCSIELAKL